MLRSSPKFAPQLLTFVGMLIFVSHTASGTPPATVPWATSAPLLSIDDLRIIAESNARGLHTVTMACILKQEFVAGPSTGSVPALAPQVYTRTMADLARGHFRIRSEVTRPDGNVTVDVQAFDGQRQSSYVPAANRGFVAKAGSEPPDFFGTLPALTNAMLMPPRADGSGVNDGSLVSFLRSKYVKLRPNLEDVNGRSCYVAELGDQRFKSMVLWLDPSRGALPLKAISYKAPDAQGEQQPSCETTIEEAAEFPDGAGARVWLPLKLTWVTHFPNYVTRARLEVIQPSVRLNEPFSEANFRVPIPLGAEVYDRQSNTSFNQGIPITPAEAEWVKADLTIGPTLATPETVAMPIVPNTGTAQPTRWLVWCAAAALVALLGAGATGAWIRRAKQGAS